MKSNQELIVIGDIHYAKEFDYLDRVLPEKIEFLNPNQKFRKILNQLSADQALVINGDLVNYYYQQYNPQEDKSSNWDLFWQELEKIDNQVWCNLGNHDYRKLAYNYTFWALTNFDVPKEFYQVNKELLKHYQFRGIKELESVLVNLKRFNPLEKYPYPKNYQVENGNQQLIFLNTAYEYFNSFYLNPIKKIRDLIKVTARGLLNRQFELLNKYLDEAKENIIFLHTPLFENFKEKEFNYQNSDFKYWLKGKKVQNLWGQGAKKFINRLSASKANIIVVTSHLHKASQHLFDKKTKTFRQCTIQEINKQRKNKNLVKFVSTLAIGGTDDQGRSGYLQINNKEIKHCQV
jgi:hypothetical protein